MSKLKYGILASGELGAICLKTFVIEQYVNFVFTDKQSKEIIDFCAIKNIPIYLGNPRQGKSKDFIEQFDTDVIFSISYLFIIESDIISHPKKYIINFHGSLLPKYRGRTPHVWAIINNEKETGISAHQIIEDCDSGDLLYQEKISIPEEITGAGLLSEFKKRYPIVLSKVADMIENDVVHLSKQDNNKASWFCKRTPLDGLINWNWQKERIKNWIRAQAKPYPGAFSFYYSQRVTIHKVEFCDYGYHQNDENGKILKIVDGITVKTPNGAIRILEYDCEFPIEFVKGEKFNG